MNLFNKLRDYLTEDVEDEPVKPVKKEMTHVEIPAPTPEEVTVDDYRDREVAEDTKPVAKVENVKDKTPAFFSDDDFADLEPKKVEPIKEKEPEPKKNGLYGVLQKEEEHKFKPSKIISPVYGVLGENYETDDITNKVESKIKPINTYVAQNKMPTLDEVRNRAFGTLEDDLEDTLTKNGPSIIEDTRKLEKPKHVKEMDDRLDTDMTLEELDQLAKNKDKKKVEGNELLDLIDSMYAETEDKGDDK